MYKFIISCYYWPSADGRLRLRSLQLKTNRRKPAKGLDFSPVSSLTTVEHNASPEERRRAPRLKAGCDAELTTSLAILDSDAQSDDESLVFFGRTKDLSAGGLSVILPSTLIDERYCGDNARVQLSLHLPTGPVNLEVNAVRCEPLRQEDAALGYLVGAQILSIDDNRDEYDEYLRSISVWDCKGQRAKCKALCVLRVALMPTLISQPTIIEAAGTKPKLIEEFVGRVNTATDSVSIARMKSPGGWVEPGQRPEFDEYTIVLSGMLRVTSESETIDVHAGRAVLVRGGEWVQYSTPEPEGAEYVAVCLPAFSMDTVHRDE